MNRKLGLMIASLIILIGAAPAAFSAKISVDVKQCDWIEYQVTYTGIPPESHAITWAVMEIVGV